MVTAIAGRAESTEETNVKTRYESAWDTYSEKWTGDPGSALGDEWSSQEFCDGLHDRFLGPHYGSESTVLEIGPGGGKYSSRVGPRCGKLICADVSQAMLDRTQERLADACDLRILKLEGFDLEGVEDDSIDFAFSIDVFVHLDLEDIYVYVREMHRVLRPGSKLVLHFADLRSTAGMDQFLREADFNRAQYKAIGRISFLTPEIIGRVLETAGFAIEEVDDTLIDRDFLVVARAAERPTDPGAGDRVSRILARTGASRVTRDLLTCLGESVRSAPDPNYLRPGRFAIGGETRDVVGAHPPSFVGFPVSVPPNAKLSVAAALHPEAAGKCEADVIEFAVSFRYHDEAHELARVEIRPSDPESTGRWHDLAIDLSAHAGRIGMILLETRVDLARSAYAWAAWGDPAIVADE